MSDKVVGLSSFLNSVSVMAKTPLADEGAVVNATRSITRLTAMDDPELMDPKFQEALAELATAARFQPTGK
jgi:hypothetical protein